MWILLIILSTGSISTLEFSNIENCQHAIDLIDFPSGTETYCIYSDKFSTVEPIIPGINTF